MPTSPREELVLNSRWICHAHSALQKGPTTLPTVLYHVVLFYFLQAPVSAQKEWASVVSILVCPLLLEGELPVSHRMVSNTMLTS